MQKKDQLTEIGNCKVICRDDQDFSRPGPLKFWEIDNLFKCPVTGMCLTLPEQKHLLKKVGVSIKKKSLFEIHETLVASSESENRLSVKVNKLLDRKFGDEAASLLELGQKEFMAYWRAAFETGDCMSLLWASASRPGLPVECRREIFGAVHMSMHYNAQQSEKMKHNLAVQQEELNAARLCIKEAVRARRTLQKENGALTCKQTGLNAKIARVGKEKTKLEEKLSESESRQPTAGFEQENRLLQEELDALYGKFMKKERQAALLKEQTMRLSSELEQQRESNRHFGMESKKIIGEAFELNRCDANCPSFDLCQKRILLVGGITRIKSLYRKLIEDSGGIFEYHDGYMQKGVKRLESSLRRADMVLCPVNCNSHAACSIVKNLGKKYDKPVHMLANSSLNVISQTIQGNGKKMAAA